MRSLLIGLMAVTLAHGVSRDASAQDPHPREVVRKELAEQKKKFDTILHGIMDDHLKAVREAEKAAIEELKTLARAEAGSGNIREATEAWTEVIKLDTTDPDANKYFRAIGREDIVKKQIAQAIEKQSPEPSKRVEWQNDKGSVYRRQPNGIWVQSWRDKDGLHQKPYVELGRTPYFIEIYHDGGHYKAHERIYGDRLFWRYASDKTWNGENKGKWID